MSDYKATPLPDMDWDAREAQPYCRCGEVSMSWGQVLDIQAGCNERWRDWAGPLGIPSECMDAIMHEVEWERGACPCEADAADFREALRDLSGAGDLVDAREHVRNVEVGRVVTVSADLLVDLLRTATGIVARADLCEEGDGEWDDVADLLGIASQLAHESTPC